MAPPILKKGKQKDGKKRSGHVAFRAEIATTAPTKSASKMQRNDDDDDDDDDDCEMQDYDSDDDYGGVYDNTTSTNPESSHKKAKKQRRGNNNPDDDNNEEEEEDDCAFGTSKTGEEEYDYTNSKFSLLRENDNNNSSQTNNKSTETTLSQDDDQKKECPVEPFNLKEEREGGGGYFEGDTYVFRRFSNRDKLEPDAWLENLENEEEGKDNGTIVGNERKPSSSSKKAAKNDDDDNAPRGITIDDAKEKAKVLRDLSVLLATSQETVSQALRRYGNILSQHRKKQKKQKRKSSKDAKKNGVDDDDNDAAGSIGMAKTSLRKVTEFADALLMNCDVSDIYELTQTQLLTLANDEDPATTITSTIGDHKRKRTSYFDGGGTASSSNDASALTSSSATPEEEEGETLKKKTRAEAQNDNTAIKWEYRGQDGQMHGPFTTQQMIEWRTQGYFVGEQAVDVRQVATSADQNTTATANVDDLMADLDSDDDDDDDDNDKEVWLKSDTADFASFTR